MTGGWIVQNRHYAANFGSRHRALLRIAQAVRWVWWAGFGWPIATTATLTFVGLFVAIPAGWLIPLAPWSTGWDRAAHVAAGWPEGQAGAALAGVLAAAVGAGKVWVDHRVEFPWLRLIAVAAGFGFPVLAVVYTTRLLGPTTVLVLAVTVAVLAVVDLVAGWLSPRWWLRRAYAEFRREIPPHWTDLAARSQRIQSIDNTVERTVTESATDRPILEHPAFGPVWQTRFDYTANAAEVPISRPEGRSFEALEAVLDEWAAQYFTVDDGPDAIRLIWPDRGGSNFASRILVRVTFKPAPRPWPHRPQRQTPSSSQTTTDATVLAGPWTTTTTTESEGAA